LMPQCVWAYLGVSEWDSDQMDKPGGESVSIGRICANPWTGEWDKALSLSAQNRQGCQERYQLQ